MNDENTPQGQLLIYNDGGLKLQVRLDGQTVWLTQAQMADLYQTSPQNITLHIQGIYDDQELPEEATCKPFLQVRQEGQRQVQRSLKHYSLDVILAVGYRVRSPRGTLFRRWATTRLSELLLKGFTLDDERIKAGRTIGADYFDELLDRIRDIRVQRTPFLPENHGHLRHEHRLRRRCRNDQALLSDGPKQSTLGRPWPHRCRNRSRRRGETQHGAHDWKNAPDGPVRKGDAAIAKNYLTQEEIESLNLIVSAYLDFAELQARSHRPMHMADWIIKLDDFLRLSERDVLTHAGRVSHDQAEEHAHAQYEEFDQRRRALEDSANSSDFDQAVRRLKDETTPKPRRRKKKTGEPNAEDIE